MLVKSSHPEFSLDEVYTGEPRKKSSGWKLCVGIMIVCIVIFAILLSLPEDMQSVVSSNLDLSFQIASPIFSIFIIFYFVYVFYADSRKKLEIVES